MARWGEKRKARGSGIGILSSGAKRELSGERNIKTGRDEWERGKVFLVGEV